MYQVFIHNWKLDFFHMFQIFSSHPLPKSNFSLLQWKIKAIFTGNLYRPFYFFFPFVSGSRLGVLRDYSSSNIRHHFWQQRRSYGMPVMETVSAMCKANVLLGVLLLRSQNGLFDFPSVTLLPSFKNMIK